MAQTTTYINACDAEMWLDNEAGTLVNISGSTNNVSMEFTNATGQLSTFGGNGWPVRMCCNKDCTITVGAVYTTANDEALDVLKNWFFGSGCAAKSFVVYLPDKNPGSDKYYGEVILESLSIPVTADEPSPISVTAVLRPTGEFQNTTTST